MNKTAYDGSVQKPPRGGTGNGYIRLILQTLIGQRMKKEEQIMYDDVNNGYDNFSEVGNESGWNTFEFTVVNAANGASVSMSSTKKNTLQEIYNAAKADLGLPDTTKKVLFINKNTQESTADSSKTLEEFGIYDSSGAIQINAEGTVA